MKADRIEISHPEKILFPDGSRTKKDLARYYRRIAGQILSYLEGRPITLYRCPEGVGKDGFYNKHAPEHFPDFIKPELSARSPTIRARAKCTSAGVRIEILLVCYL